MGEWNGMEIWVVLSVHKTYQRLWNSTKCFNQNISTKMLSYSPPTLFTNFFLFGFFFFLIFYFFLYFSWGTLFLLFVFDFLSFFLWTTAKIKLLQLSFRYNHRIPSIKDKKSLSKSCKHNVTMVMEFLKWWNAWMWSGVNKGKLMMYMAQVGYS